MTAREIRDYFISQGMTLNGAYAMLGNWEKESSNLRSINAQSELTPLTDEEYTAAADAGTINFIYDSVGYGMAQWTYWSRKKALLEFAKEKGVSVGDAQMQCEFTVYEMKTRKPNVWRTVTNPDAGLLECVTIVCTEYEKPAVNNIDARYTEAKRYRDLLNTAEKEAETMTKDEAVKKLVAIATAEIGYLEKRSNAQLDDKKANAGSMNWNKYARDIDTKHPNFYNGRKNGYAWCDIFVDWCFIQAFGYDRALKMLYASEKSAGAGCEYSANYYRANGRFATAPMVGDQIFFGNYGAEGHTGIVVEVKGNIITTIEGNTSGGAGIDANGDGVYRKTYDISNTYIPGYGRPNWAVATGSVGTTGTSSNTGSSLPDISYGYKGEYVKKAQKLLIAKGYSCGKDGADGDFGKSTLAAVRKFQTDNKLTVDGVVGAETWAALEKKTESKPVTKPETNVEKWTPPGSSTTVKVYSLKKGNKHNQVKTVQRLLTSPDYYNGEVDGLFGAQTEKAVKTFQTASGLLSDGEVGVKTWAALINL